MQVNWARWQQPIGGNSNYNFQFQSFHCAIVPQTPQTQRNTSWQEQLQFQLVYLNLLSQYQQFSSSSFNGLLGSRPQSFNSSVNRGQNYTRYNNYSNNNSSSKKTKTFTEQPSKIIPTPNPTDNNNSIDNDETMEPKDFVMATRFNAFAINFKNTNAISEDQVQEIFSVYGKIKRVKQTGNENGLCFVNFENEEDALKAVVGVKGHPDFKLRPSKLNRSKNSSDFNNANGNNDDHFNGNNYSNENSRKNYSTSSRENNYFSDNNKTDCFNASDDKIVESTSDKFSAPISSEVNTEIKTTETTEPEKVSSYGDKYITNTIQSPDPPVSILEPVVDHRHEDNDKSDQRSTISSKSEVQIPELIAKISKMSMASPMEGVPIEKMAVEVLVANIPEGVNVHAILQMLDKYHPIAATNILTYEPSNMRYCRVYFTSQQRAEDVEAEFDNCVLLNKPLLVVRASNFIN